MHVGTHGSCVRSNNPVYSVAIPFECAHKPCVPTCSSQPFCAFPSLEHDVYSFSFDYKAARSSLQLGCEKNLIPLPVRNQNKEIWHTKHIAMNMAEAK